MPFRSQARWRFMRTDVRHSAVCRSPASHGRRRDFLSWERVVPREGAFGLRKIATLYALNCRVA